MNFQFELTTILVGVVTFLAVYSIQKHLRRHKLRLPPQPGPALPVIGHLYKLKRDPRPQLAQWRNELGDIFSFYVGSQLKVVISGVEMNQKINREELFMGRPSGFTNVATGIPDRGIISCNGADWREQKTTTLAILKQFGMGKNSMAEKITEEASFFVERLEELKGRATNIQSLILVTVSNVICSVIIGRRFQYEDETFKGLISRFGFIGEYMTTVGALSVFPFLKYLPGDPYGGKRVTKIIREVIELADGYTQNGSKKFQENNVDNQENLIDAYIEVMEKKKQSGQKTFLDQKSLTRIVYDLMIGGIETTTTGLEWCLLFILHHPQVQRRIFEEIEQEIGVDRLPTTRDKTKLVYLNAVIMETLRVSCLAPMTVRTNSEDVVFENYDIPQGTTVLLNFGAGFSDRQIWGEDAHCFRPDRFIDSKHALIYHEALTPFGFGKRQCIGKSLATMELFLFLAILFQKFEFLPADPDNLPSLKSRFGLVCAPEPYEIRVVSRRDE